MAGRALNVPMEIEGVELVPSGDAKGAKPRSPRTRRKKEKTWQEVKLENGDYRDDPVSFVHEVLGVRLWDKQMETMLAIRDNARVSVKSGNGLGKGFLAGCIVLWWMATRDPAICITTAPTSRQGRFILWRQIHALHARAPGLIGGRLLEARLDYSEQRYAVGITAEGGTQFQGFHSPALLVIVDEAMGVGEEIYEAIEGMMTAGGPKLLLLGNPTGVTGAFYRSFHRESSIYKGITFNALDSPNVVAGETYWPGLVTAEWVEERKTIWGEDSPLYRSRVLGEFPEVGDGGLFNMRRVDEAVGRTIEVDDDEPFYLGVDVARYGDDSSCISIMQGPRVLECRTANGYDTMRTADWVRDVMGELPDLEQVGVDEVGVGAGVVDRLLQLGEEKVLGINVGRPAWQKRLYSNLRSEGYHLFKGLVERGEIELPDYDRLVEELADVRYTFDSNGLVAIESKADLKARGGWSPDVADSVVLGLLVKHAAGPRLWT